MRNSVAVAAELAAWSPAPESREVREARRMAAYYRAEAAAYRATGKPLLCREAEYSAAEAAEWDALVAEAVPYN